MNSSEPSVTKKAGWWEQVRPAFNWIEFLAIPIASSIMDTQPIALVLLWGAAAFAGENASPLLDMLSITLLILALQWWAMLMQHFVQRGLNEEWAKFLHPVGFCAAFALTVGTHPILLGNVPGLIIVLALVTWFWRRGMRLARTVSSGDYLIAAFKFGFGVLLLLLIITFLYFTPLYPSDPAYTVLHDAVGRGLTIFFLSGIISLSFTRIALIRRENAYRSPGNSLADPTRAWLVVLTLLWVVITLLALAFETFSFEPILQGMSWLWNALGMLVNWVLSVIYQLFSSLFKLLSSFIPPIVPPAPPHLPHPFPALPGSLPLFPPLPISLLLLLRLVFLLSVIALALLAIRAILRMWRVASDDDSEEEVREGLSMQSILQSRREEREKQRARKSDGPALESLDPDSARAHYRELLQEVALNRAELARRPNETPSEYEVRLLNSIERTASSEAQQESTPTDSVLLDELTRAYMLERYGGKRAELPHRAYLPEWVGRFVKRMPQHQSRNTS
jgi:hypothetical protein